MHAAVNSLSPPGCRLVRVKSLNLHERQPGVQIAFGASPSVLHRGGGSLSDSRRPDRSGYLSPVLTSR